MREALRRQEREHAVEQVADVGAVLGRDAEGLAQAQRVELVDRRVPRLVLLVDDQQATRGASPEPVRDRLVEVGHAGLRVHHEEHERCVIDRDLGLAAHHRVALRAVRIARPRSGQEPARVHQQERAPRPFGARGVTVARDARAVVDHGAPLAEHAVEEGGLAHVGASDDGDDGSGHGNPGWFRDRMRCRIRPGRMARRAGGCEAYRRRAESRERDGAGNGVRTRDLKLGKLALYQLSYARTWLECLQ